MKPERRRQIKQLYNRALEIQQSGRAAFLRDACAGDEKLLRELEGLLAEEPQGTSLSDATSPWIGREVGNYQFVSIVGAGGMGEVYRARDTRLKRDVAIKILPEELSHDEDRVGRLQREAQVLASLNHPNIAAIYDLEEQGEARFLILELVEGETIEQRLKGGPIPPAEALRIASQIAEGLAAAHERGIIHRDLKPANIKQTPEGTAKVLDFGLAKAFVADAEMTRLNSLPVSTPGTILGTAAYMSPEQLNGAALDPRSDIFAFGAVLYEMLTGQRAFPGETLGDILAAVVRAEPDWAKLPADTPLGIRRLLRRCLQKDRKRRLQSVADARLEIDDLQSEPIDVVAVPRARRRTLGLWIAFLFLVVAAAIAVFAVSYLRAPIESSEMRLEIRAPAISDQGSFAISPDGRQLVFVASGDAAPRLWLRPLDTTTAQPLAGTEGASRPFWSPDSRSVAFFAVNKLKRTDINGGLPQTLAETPGGGSGTWSPDGTIVFAAAGTLFRIPASGVGEAIALTEIDAPGQTRHLYPRFLPGGRQFLFFAQGLPETQGIYLGSLDSAETRRLTAADTAGSYLPSGWLIFGRQGTLLARRFDLSSGQVSGDPVTVADSVDFDSTSFLAAFSVSATGVVAYRSQPEWQLAWFDHSGNPLGVMGAARTSVFATSELSPDGRRVVTHRLIDGNRDIFLLDAVRSTRFTSDAAVDWHPIWSPDGSRIVFGSTRNGSSQLYEKPSSNVGSEALLMETAGSAVPNDWSSDGRSLLYGISDSKAPGLWLQPFDANGKRQGEPYLFRKASPDVRWGQFSPDGRWVAYQSNESGPYEIYVRPFPGPGGQWQVSTSGGIQARWSPDGNELYYIAPNGTLMAAPITTKGASMDPGTPVPLFRTRIWGGGTSFLFRQNYDVSADGRFLISVTEEDVANLPITILLNWKPPAK